MQNLIRWSSRLFLYTKKSKKGIFVYKDLRRCPRHNTSIQWFVPCCIASYPGAALRLFSIVCAPTNVAVEFECFFGLASEISLFQITFGVSRHLIARDWRSLGRVRSCFLIVCRCWTNKSSLICDWLCWLSWAAKGLRTFCRSWKRRAWFKCCSWFHLVLSGRGIWSFSFRPKFKFVWSVGGNRMSWFTIYMIHY